MKIVVDTAYKFRIMLFFVMILLCTPNFSQQQQNTPQFLYGIASWYGDDFAGKITASGQTYLPTELTAAHRSLPFGTRVQVENLSNGKKIEVIINDRGPFVQNRVIDLSKQAADILGFLNDGTTFVKVSIIELGSSLETPLGVPNPSIGKDIPQGFSVSNTNTPSVERAQLPTEDNTPDRVDPTFVSEKIDDDFFADVDDEFDFMDDSFDDVLSSQPEQVRTQGISNIPELSSNTSPPGFLANTNEFLINDPLSNITLGPEDEFVAIPSPSPEELATVPTPAMQEDIDPFADLFDGPVDSYKFQEEVDMNSSTPLKQDPPAQNIGSSLNALNSSISNELDDVNDDFSESNYFEDPYIEPIPQQQLQQPQQQPYESNTPPSPPVPTPSSSFPQKMSEHYVIQLGAFSKQKNALNLYEKLRASGFNAFITDIKVKGRNLIRVRVGYFNDIQEAISLSQRLESEQGVENRIIKVDYEETLKK